MHLRSFVSLCVLGSIGVLLAPPAEALPGAPPIGAVSAASSTLEALLEVPLLKKLYGGALPAPVNGLYTFKKDGTPAFYAKQGPSGWVAIVPLPSAVIAKLDPLNAVTFNGAFFVVGSSNDVKALFGTAVLGGGAIPAPVGDSNADTADVSLLAFVTPKSNGPFSPLLKAKIMASATHVLVGTLSADVVGVFEQTAVPSGQLSLLAPDSSFASAAPGGPKLVLHGISYQLTLSGGHATLSGQASSLTLDKTTLPGVKLSFLNPTSANRSVVLSSSSKKALPAIGSGPLAFQVTDLALSGTLTSGSGAFALEGKANWLKASLGMAINVTDGNLDARFRVASAPPIALPNDSGSFVMSDLSAMLEPGDAALDLAGALTLKVQGKALNFNGNVSASTKGVMLSGTMTNAFASPAGAFGLSGATLYGALASDGVAVGLRGKGNLGSTQVNDLTFCVAGVPGTLKQAGLVLNANDVTADSLFAMTNEVLTAAKQSKIAKPTLPLPSLKSVNVYYLTPTAPVGVTCANPALGLNSQSLLTTASVPLMGLGNFGFKLTVVPEQSAAAFDATLTTDSGALRKVLRDVLPGYAATENRAVRSAQKALVDDALDAANATQEKVMSGIKDLLGGTKKSLSDIKAACKDLAKFIPTDKERKQAKALCSQLDAAISGVSKAEAAVDKFENSFDDSLSRSRSALAVLSSRLEVKKVRVYSKLGGSGEKAKLELVLGLGDFDLTTLVELGASLPSSPEALGDLLKGNIALSFDEAAKVTGSGAAKAKEKAKLRPLDHVSTALEWADDMAYLFDDAKYQRIGIPGKSPGFGIPDQPHLRDRPLRGVDAWKNCRFCYGMDAAFRKGGTAYFFKGDEYVRWDVEDDKLLDQTPQKIANLWPTLDADFKQGFDAATVGGSDFEWVYLFKGNRWLRVKLSTGHADAPQLISVGWKIDDEFDKGIDSAFNNYAGKLYFFKGSKYIRLTGNKQDDDFPRVIKGNWP